MGKMFVLRSFKEHYNQSLMTLVIGIAKWHCCFW